MPDAVYWTPALIELLEQFTSLPTMYHDAFCQSRCNFINIQQTNWSLPEAPVSAIYDLQNVEFIELLAC